MIGQIIGNYKIEEKLGEGGMGAVYRGIDTMLDREVAIKALRPELASQTAVVERFRSEAVTLAKLNHANIATLYTMMRQGDELYMVLEFVRGETLDNIMQRRGALPSDEAIPVFCQVLDGIDHAHELGIVHRDIKPANMMLTEKGTLKVLDFGIARLLGSARMTRAGNIIGTLEYMAPEQVKGQETDGRSDIYALGMMLYEVLTGRLPFQTENEFELMKLQTEETPVHPCEVNPSIPAEVGAAIMQAIQKDPEMRFQTAGEMRAQLLDAGFASAGTMHGVTGTFRTTAGATSRPPVSKTDAEPEKKEIKATRLGGTETNAKSEKVAKATRLGVAVVEPVTASSPESKSFLSSLSTIHYVGAGVAALVLVGALALIPLMLRGGGSDKPVETKQSTPAIQTPVKTPEVATAPSADPAPVTSEPVLSPPPGATNTTLSAPPSSDVKPLVPIEEKASTDAPKTDKAAAPKPVAPKPAAPVKPKTTKKSAEDLLTGN